MYKPITWVLLALVSTAANATLEETFYMLDVISATALIRDAVMVKSPPEGQLEKQMSLIVNQRDAFKKVRLKLDKYKNSKNQSIQQSYPFVASILLVQESSFAGAVQLMEASMNMNAKDAVIF